MSTFSYYDEQSTFEERLREAYEERLIAAKKTMWDQDFASLVRQHAADIQERERAQKMAKALDLVEYAIKEASDYMDRKNYTKAGERLRQAERLGKLMTPGFDETTEPVASAWRELLENRAIDLLQTNSFEEVLRLPNQPIPKLQYARAMALLQLASTLNPTSKISSLTEEVITPRFLKLSLNF